jgi:uncharacterized protein (TIGR02145 family)
MRQLLGFLAIFCLLHANAQPYSISFSGTGLSTVKVQNLTTGVIVDVPAGDVLLLSTPAGISEFNNMEKTGLKVYPNPMTDKSTLEILPPLAGDAIISVCDMTGKVIIQFKGYVDNSIQQFSLSGIKNGLYVINIQGEGYHFSKKFLSSGKSNGTAAIARVSNNIKAVAENKSIMDSKGGQANVNMSYNPGERLKYVAVSGNNSTVMTDIPTADKTVNFSFTECKDGDNVNYPVIVIGTQTWMAENLKTITYRNGVAIGTTIPYNKDISAETEPKYQWAYDGNENNVPVYGRLYTWYAVADTRNVCPTGWHVPSDDEWTTMRDYLIANGYNFDGTTSGNNIAKSLASTTNWNSSAVSGAVGNTDYPAYRNKTGFTALPGGDRGASGPFYSVGNVGYWWSGKELETTSAWYHYMNSTTKGVNRNTLSKKYGFSVRCVRDN